MPFQFIYRQHLVSGAHVRRQTGKETREGGGGICAGQSDFCGRISGCVSGSYSGRHKNQTITGKALAPQIVEELVQVILSFATDHPNAVTLDNVCGALLAMPIKQVTSLDIVSPGSYDDMDVFILEKSKPSLIIGVGFTIRAAFECRKG